MPDGMLGWSAREETMMDEAPDLTRPVVACSATEPTRRDDLPHQCRLEAGHGGGHECICWHTWAGGNNTQPTTS